MDVNGAPAPAAAGLFIHRVWPLAVLLTALVHTACVLNPRPRSHVEVPVRESSTSVLLHGKPLELHLAVPQKPSADDVIVLYASGDGGWFGAAVDMFRLIARAGYRAVGFSSRAFLKVDRPRGAPVSPSQLAREYEDILARARAAMRLSATTPAILTGWSRGAAFAVLVGSERAARSDVRGVIAIGLGEGEDLEVNGPSDETDEGERAEGDRQWPFEPYAQIAHLGSLPCAVIQASRDNYLPAATAHDLFGPDTPVRRFYAIEARNHRFSGGKAAFHDALIDAIRWMAPPLPRPEETGTVARQIGPAGIRALANHTAGEK